ELENSFTAALRTNDDHSFKQFNFENELEYGLTEKFTARVKASYFYEDSHEFTGMHFDAAGVEGQYFFTNPNVDPIGISLIGSAEAGERSLAFETVLVVQKDFEKSVVAYNLGLSCDIDNAFHAGGGVDVTGTVTNAAGALYLLSPAFGVGAEASLESSYDSFRKYAGSNLFAGPVLRWVPNRNLWVTVGFDVQLTN